ncbi:MAG: S4 domain-containing protein [Pseudomonadales bacterium]|jgi:ribosome-associated heat shock protein Hsp15|nr:S4 domain-containing protein [Pseudomonadales bacterium]
MSPVRIDRWLWAARFFKTRSLAKAAVEGGKVHVDGQRSKPAKTIRVGQTVEVRKGTVLMTVIVTDLAEQRGSAQIAQALYEETPESIEKREIMSSRRKMERAGLQVPSTKPSKKDRRDLRKLKDRSEHFTDPDEILD